jgi:protein required for attachment to host cells
MDKQSVMWVVVADGSRAHVFRRLAPRKGALPPFERFERIEVFSHDEARAKLSDLLAGDKGRKRGSGYRDQPGLGEAANAKETEATRFARELASRLLHALNERSYDELVLFAPPRFLGVLRSALEPRVSEAVRETIGKDYTNLSPVEIGHKIGAALAA